MSNTDAYETLDVALFCAGEWRAGFEARQVRTSRPATAEATGDKIETLLGLAQPENIAPHQYLQLKQTNGDKEILVRSPVDLLSLPVTTIHPLPPLVAARCKLHSLRALALALAPEHNDGAVILLLNADMI